MQWFQETARSLPWRAPRTPYRVWVSEFMLQQTTVPVVEARFEGFVARFPSFAALARASLEEVLQAWAGLGYYRRARALWAGACIVMQQHGGRLPKEEGTLRKLPGVGPYTAAAILALAHNQPVVAVDGNVARVLARFLGEAREIDKNSVRQRLGQSFQPLIPKGAGAATAEALIELGATVCRGPRPLCPSCPLKVACVAKQEALTDVLPRRTPRKDSVSVCAIRALAERRGRLLVVRRSSQESLLPGFLELPGAWVAEARSAEQILAPLLESLGFKQARLGPLLAQARHNVTRHRIRAMLHRVHIFGGRPRSGALFLKRDELAKVRLTTESRKLLAACEEA